MSADEEQSEPQEPGLLAELLATTAGVGVQLASEGAAGTLAGAALPVAVLAALRLDAKAAAARLTRAARSVEVAAQELGVEVEELERRAGATEEALSLTARVLAASANAVRADDKIKALGKVLALGLDQDTRMDEALLLAAALEDMEAPHVRMLLKFAHVAFRGDERLWMRIGAPTWRAAPWHSDDATVAPLLAALTRHGLLEQMTVDRQGVNGVERTIGYDITDLVSQLLVLLEVPVPNVKHPLA